MPTAKRSRGNKLTISNPEKLLYPAARFRKVDVVEYYVGVAPYLLPHFKNRPVTLKRYPEGVHGEFFYEKDAPSFTPDWVKTAPVPRREGGPDIRYILINDLRTLGWCANIAALELHPFLHVAPRIETPTLIVFDLDPGEGADIFNCAEVAFLLRDLLANLRLKSFAKVSGSKGLQIYVPLNSPTSYDATQPFARAVAEMLEREHAKLIVSDMAKNLRVGKVFIDWSQNADHKTTVGVYSLRAKRERPYVSMPMRWEELERAVKKHDKDALYFTPAEALQRLKKVGDLFAPVLKLRQKLPAEFAARARSTPGSARESRALPKVRSLADYDAKRNFAKTNEPAPDAPRRSRQGGRRRFVVQKHAASHLHYDFRLEMHDVLKSWAVPRGVPTKSADVRSAFETEDHPIDYLDFEGVIPEGQYGGGTVMVWDIGTYDVVDGNYWKGALTIFLNGKKLKGEWTLKRTDEENGKTKWLLVKNGGNAKAISAKREVESAISGRTMEQIAREKSAVWQSNRGETKQTSSPKVPGARASSRRASASLPKPSAARGKKPETAPELHAVPKFVPPMKATAVEKLPSGDEWLYEVKWDGYRALALKSGSDVRLLSLKNKSLSADFPAVVDAVRGINADTAIIDGEVVAVNANGKPAFQVLQNRKSLGRDWLIVYYAFDLLQLADEDLKRLPLDERKAKLRKLIDGSEVRYSAELSGEPDAIVASIQHAGLEGVVAKRRASIYQARTRSVDWLKLRLGHSQEFVIGGYNPDGDTFQSLLVGYDDGAKLIFAGKVRQGFDQTSRRTLMKQVAPLATDRCPFANLPSSKKSHFGEGVTAEDMKKLRWLKPKLLAQVRFAEWTTYNLLRHATFLGLRDDKSPREVVRET
jgi:bifunctional non-homologous end joining protein LigD